MKVHHLDCACMCPIGGALVNGSGWPWQTACLVAHVLLIETDDGLILVDTGVGTRDLVERSRLGLPFNAFLRPRIDRAHTALGQVEALGFSARDVRHIVPTHLDLDHAGGLPDFPDAEVHLLQAERDAALHPSLRERERYRAVHFEHGPRWKVHETGGEAWYGLDCVRELGVGPEVLLVPTVGHSRGHCAVAVNSDRGWLLHCGDAYFHNRESDPLDGGCTPLLSLFQNIVAMDRGAMRANKERIRQLRRGHPEVEVFCAHDPDELRRYTEVTGSSPAPS